MSRVFHIGRDGELDRERPPGAGAQTSGLRRRVPGLDLIRHYPIGWLPHDLAAGLVLSAMLVPVGIAYAVASGLPGVHGLYATIIPLLVYALFGASRILVVAPDSALATLILATVLPLSGGDPVRAVTLAGAMAILTGLVLLLFGFLRLGFVTELLSKPIRYGYMNGIALTVIVSQLPKMFQVSIESTGPVTDVLHLAEAVAGGHANWTATAIAVATLAIILAAKRWLRMSGILLAVVVATAAVAALGLDGSAGVKVLGPLPEGLPSFSVPLVGVADLGPLLLGASAAALVAFADTSVLSRSYAARMHARADTDQEMVALGASNLAAGLFQGFPVSSSSSRTPIAEAAGAKTQLTGVAGAAAVTVLILFAPNLLQSLPLSALAAVVIAAAIGLFEVTDLRRIYRIQRWEFWLSMLCFASVAVLGAIQGILIAVVVAVIEFLWDGWRPYFAVLGRVEGVRGYHDLRRHPDARSVPGLLIFRWDAPLFFANAELFGQSLEAEIAAAPTPVKRVILAAEPITSVDVTAADMLADLHARLGARGIELRIAEMKDPVKDKLRRFEMMPLLGEDSFHPTVSAAVDAHVADHRVEWSE